MKKNFESLSNFVEDVYRNVVECFFGKTMEDVRNRKQVAFVKIDDEKKILYHQTKLTSNGIHEAYENCDIFTFNSQYGAYAYTNFFSDLLIRSSLNL